MSSKMGEHIIRTITSLKEGQWKDCRKYIRHCSLK
jgi:hypothetical protein